MITVLRAGPLTTVQDLGRPGHAHLGVPRSGALDEPALRLANRFVGNPDDAAGLETTLLGCALRFAEAALVAVTGAVAQVDVNGRPVERPHGQQLFEVPAGGVLDIKRASRGVRSYIAVAGGINVEPVLGSRSTDTLSGLGPARLIEGADLPVGVPSGAPSLVGEPARIGGELVLGIRLGPRDDWFESHGLFGSAYQISPLSNRVGARLAGNALTRRDVGELPSEGVVLGAVQVPADGQPIIFLADHPTTGGYPVIGVVDDVTPLAQARPGTSVRFRELD
ncbi:biotin-dependent carboxyltransferase family protein [Actinoplanes sichuanensis]|uniref:Biotin-dependent carboxyltransferase family protein n=1 Tax=Actinoplanes sichuanensis TaxID=512349 RepID=A0ABW4A5B9_9ACTN|nr:biotin-dependent carboxyltransferase family protein [Actinoplanes sichuanensis]BEL10550.1 biotin-dependent carboxyltransferase family protein [Actinoplanes sichuanensis]